MPLAKLKPTSFSVPAHGPMPPFADAGGVAATPSPARRLQQRLEYQAAALVAPDVSRWPIGRSVALIVASSVALWAAIIEAGAALVRAVA